MLLCATLNHGIISKRCAIDPIDPRAGEDLMGKLSERTKDVAENMTASELATAYEFYGSPTIAQN